MERLFFGAPQATLARYFVEEFQSPVHHTLFLGIKRKRKTKVSPSSISSEERLVVDQMLSSPPRLVCRSSSEKNQKGGLPWQRIMTKQFSEAKKLRTDCFPRQTRVTSQFSEAKNCEKVVSRTVNCKKAVFRDREM